MTSPSVVPAPVSLTYDSAARPFVLRPGTSIAGGTDAAAALARIVGVRTGLALGIASADAEGAAITLAQTPGGAPESYRIAVDEASVRLTAPDPAGLFYGAQTLGQLIAAHGGSENDEDRWSIPSVAIDDAPRFAYRGVMLDVARHFFPVEVVTAYIDRAASLKFNALHLHLSDDQGWRIELSSRPRLTEAAASTAVGTDAGGFYTRSQYREIVEYAAARHMIVVPEVDVPGHTHAVGLAYPELAEAPVLSEHILEMVRDHGGDAPTAGEPYRGMAVGFSSLKIHDEATYDFLADVFGELASMTPGPYLHVGGDEALGTSPDDFAEFLGRVTTIVADLGKIPIAWHEAGSAPDIDDSTIGQYWGFTTPTDGMDEKARAFVRNGSQLILSPADAVYLDMKVDAESRIGLTWANGPTSVEDAYSWDPAGIIAGVGEQDVLGVEAPLWTETIRTLADIDESAFPRIAAAAEVAWSPAPTGAGPRTWASFRERAAALAPMWRSMGVGFSRSGEIPWTAA